MTDICGYDLSAGPHGSVSAYDPCPCLLPAGHLTPGNGRVARMHACDHIIKARENGFCGGLDPGYPGRYCRFKAGHAGPCIDKFAVEG